MSSLLRSTKILRYLTGAARTLVLGTTRTLDCSALCNSKHASALLTDGLRGYGSASRDRERERDSVEPLLQRLDAEVRRCGRVSRRDADELLLEASARRVTSSQSLLLIRCCGELMAEEVPAARTRLAQQIWSVLSERGVPVDISHYNALLRVYLENEHPFSPAEFLDELDKKGLQPNRVTYQRLMWRYCQAGEVEGATRVLEKMRELALPVSEPVLNALVMGHAFHGDAEGARAVLDTMAGAGLQPTNRTYALLACGYARSGDVDAIRNVIQQATDKDIFMADKDLMDIVESLAAGGYGESVDYFMQLMQRGAGYNQDAFSLILRLINRNCEDIAVKVLRTMSMASPLDGKETSQYRGAFFVKQLLKVTRPTDLVISTCRRLQEEGLVPLAMLIATEAALQQGHVYLARQLFKELKQDGAQIRQHYYWPLLIAKGKAGDEEGLLEILRSMSHDDVMPSGETLQDYVIPYLRNKNDPETVVLKLQGANIPAVRAARSLVLELLQSGELKEAAKIGVQFRTWGYIPTLARPLLNCLSKIKDVESFVELLHAAADGPQPAAAAASPQDDDTEGTAERKGDSRRELSSVILGAVKVLKEPEAVERLLTLLLARGVGLSGATAQSIQEYLGESMNARLSEKLSQLTSAELELSPVQRTSTRARGAGARSAPQLEALLAQAAHRGADAGVAGLRRQLLAAYVAGGEEQKLNALLSELESEEFVLTGATLAQLIEFYSQRDDLEKAMMYKERLAQREPDFVLNKYKVLRLTFALVRAARVDDALALLAEHKQDKRDADGQSFLYNSLCWQILNHLAEQKDEQQVVRVLEAMLQSGFAEPSNSLLGALVKVHLLKEDVAAAMLEFERCCRLYRCTPWKGELTRRLIAAESATLLQKLTDLSTEVHGEVNSLHDLVLAFVECGRLRQARRILETPGLRSRAPRLDAACERYLQEGKTECLEGLLEATKELSHIDRSNMFYQLLVCYCRAGLTDKALGLWTLLQEQGEVPSEPFLLHLGAHLRANGQPVPFVLPAEPAPAPAPATATAPRRKHKPTQARGGARSQLADELKKAVVKREADSVLRLATSGARGGDVSRRLYGDALALLVDEQRTEDAVLVLEAAVRGGTHPESGAVRYLLKKCAEAGDEEMIVRVGAALDEERRREATYDNKLTQARVARGAGAQHLQAALEAVRAARAAPDPALDAAVRMFPRGDALAALLRDPATQRTCDEIASAAAERGSVVPDNMLWQEYTLEGREAEAARVWERSLRAAPRLMFRRLLQEAHERDAPHLVRALLERLSSNPHLAPSALGNAHSRLVALHLARGRTADALAALRAAPDSRHINPSVLARLKAAVLAEGNAFDYPAPASAASQ